jgi:acyl-CoA synthetase (AMP-forming)/AMP-acid ligase II/thioesterase domain-containing protein/acyl carrier protein
MPPSLFQTLFGRGSIEDIGLGLCWDPATLAGEVTRRATILSQMGIGRGCKVAIAHSNSARFFADLFAVWTVGATAACLDSTLTSTEFEIVIGFTKPAAILVDRSAPPGRFLAPILELPSCRASSVETIFTDSVTDDPALVLFTSGTTGNPKGVVLSFRALKARLELNIAAIGEKVLKRALVTLPTHFGHGLIGNALTPIMAGGHVVLLPRGFSLPENLGQVIDMRSISFMSSVPALWHAATRLSRPPSGNSLARVHVGSSPLSARLWSDVVAWSRAEVVNCYGMTETANWIAGASSRSHGIADGLVGGVWGGHASVIDDDGRIESIGNGELTIKSPALMSGYLNREDLTTSAMINGWFRTGDRGTIDELGRIWLGGRIKDEINCAGFKVQPAEIDSLLETYPGIAEACAFAVPDPISGERIGAAVRFTTGANASIDHLRSWCRERLRRRAVPDRWFVVDHIPRNARGKVNRDAVARTLLEASKCRQSDRDSLVDNPMSVGRRDRAEGRTDDTLTARIRYAVKTAWTTILDEQSFQADTQWCEAGGDSLSALQLWHKIESELGTKLPLETLTQGITPTKLVNAIEAILNSDESEARDADRQLPLVFFFPHAHGDTPSLAEFRSIMKDQIRFVVIHYPQLRDMMNGGGRFDLLVDAAEAQILLQNGEKPCLMIGTSFGGFVAWETARRLTAAGRRVAFLGLIDSRLAARPRGFFTRVNRLFTHNWWRSDYFRSVRRPMRIFILAARGLAMYFPLSVLNQIDRLAMLLPAKAVFEFRLALVSQLRAKSLRKNVLEPLEVPTTLFRSDEYVMDLPDHGWNRLCDQLAVVPIRGSHVSMKDEELCANLVQAVEISERSLVSGGDINVDAPA